jgi:hypothetical protein
MDRYTKTDLRRAPVAPRDRAPQPTPTGDEEHALLFGEADEELQIAPPLVQPDTDPMAD